MDNGYVIPGLNEDWTLLGAKLSEWMSGFIAFMLSSTLFEKPARAMPIMLLFFIGTALGLAALRRRFPDEEKGMRNLAFMTAGLLPPGIPAPAAMQPIWSGAPLRKLDENCDFVRLKLDDMLKKAKEDNEGPLG